MLADKQLHKWPIEPNTALSLVKVDIVSAMLPGLRPTYCPHSAIRILIVTPCAFTLGEMEGIFVLDGLAVGYVTC